MIFYFFHFFLDETYNVDADYDGLNQYLDYHFELSKDVEDTKLILLNLQNLLLTGVENMDNTDCLQQQHDDIFYEGTSSEEQVVVLKSKIQQLEILCNDMRQELSYSKNESVHVNGLQCGLQTRLNDQDNTILQMKSEILQLSMTNEQLNKEKNDLIVKIDDRTRMVNELKVNIKQKKIMNFRIFVFCLV